MSKRYIIHSDGAYYDGENEGLREIIPSESCPPTVSRKAVDGGGKRLNSGKVPLSMVPNSAIYAIARVFEAGAKKYEKNNWRRGMNHTIPYECALRHLLKYAEGEDRDDETGELHLAHALTNIAMLIEYQTSCPHLDDRFEGVQATYKQFEPRPQVMHKFEITEADLEEMNLNHLKQNTKE